MKQIKYLSLFLVVCILVGCGDKNIENRWPWPGPPKISLLAVMPECQRIVLEQGESKIAEPSGEFMLYCSNLLEEDYTIENAPREIVLEERLREEILKYIENTKYEDEYLGNISLILLNGAVEEFTITANKTVFGVAPGEKLNDHFLAITRNDLNVSYPDLEVLSGGVNVRKFQEIENLVGPNLMMHNQIILKPKEVPTENWRRDNKEITFTISKRLVGGKELSASQTVVFLEAEDVQ